MSSLFVYCVVFLVLWFLSNEAAVSQSTDPFKCNYTTRCEGLFGFSDCKNGQCECRSGFYFSQKLDLIEERSRIYCQICPNFGERCDVANCCRHPEYVGCIDGICRCRDSSMDSCLHFEPNTELMIAAKLALFGIILVSLAILLMVLRRSCGGEDYDSSRSAYRRDRIYASLNSIQRFVLAKMQDRPPPYDELESPGKPPPYSVALSDQERYGYDAPPPYSVSMFAQASSSREYPGISNPVFTDSTEAADPTTILPITLPSSAAVLRGETEGQAEDSDLSDLKRPVLTASTVRRMSNYSTFTTPPEQDLIAASTSTFSSDSVTQGRQPDTLTRSSSGPTAGPSLTSKPDEGFPIIPSHCHTEPSFDFNAGLSLGPAPTAVSSLMSDPSLGACGISQDTLVDWSGKEVKPHPSRRRSSAANYAVQTTDLPFPEPSVADDWLSSTLGPVIQEAGIRRDSDQPKPPGNKATFFISRRRDSENSTISDCSEPDSMSFARDYYTYNHDDDVFSLFSHIHSATNRVETAYPSSRS